MMTSKRSMLDALHRVRVLQTIHSGIARRRWEIAELLVMCLFDHIEDKGA